MAERLQKVLANIGLGSRREIEQWISDRRVSVNGKIVTLGTKVEDNDTIRVNGHVVKRRDTKTKVLIYNKPDGEVCTRTDPEGRTTVFEALPKLHQGRWVMVGRLDINTSGLLLFTNNGELANRLMHPSYQVSREYAVRVLGELESAAKQQLLTGVMLDEGSAKFTTVIPQAGEGVNRWYHVTLAEGKNREVRKLFEAVGSTVSRLIRVRYGSVKLPRSIRRGVWEYLNNDNLKDLMELVKLPPNR